MSFPPGIVVAVKALACELHSESGRPLSRYSMAEIRHEAIRRGLVASIGEATIWRWLSADAIRPWHHRSWSFPRDPDFGRRAGRVLDLYEGLWEGTPLAPDEFVICADEKTSVQARRRKHPITPAEPGQPMRVEHEYQRKGAWAYLAAWDIHQARSFGRCERKTGIRPFQRLVHRSTTAPHTAASVASSASCGAQPSWVVATWVRRWSSRWPGLAGLG